MPLNQRSTPRRIAGLLVAAAALVFTVAACGGSDDSSSASGTPGGGGPGGANGFAAYTECLSQNGVTITMPSGMARNRPSADASGYPRGNWPSGGARPSGAPDGTRPSGGPGRGGFGSGFQKPGNVDDATWQKAQSACASLRPSMGAGRGNQGGNGLDAAYTNCLKDHGVTDLSTLTSTDATVTEAKKACQALAPAASPSPTS
ncbi:hypothetical protein [Actinoplanes sp. TFC3]|uniref:hypothetical protein n=1 Tax=Actinoplanes sp. TFC3 TaxID=1710355 RepID=UPI0008371CAA|nr:hypothetical protein [Actinoplanes sp. TFC3]